MAGPRVVLRGGEAGREGRARGSANSLALVDAGEMFRRVETKPGWIPEGLFRRS